jgi:hypothetical protein
MDMPPCRTCLILLVLVVATSPASAGIFRKNKAPNPAERVGELLNTLRSDPDERKRLGAAEELRQFDARLYPNILPALIDSLANDPSSSVRAEAASSLGKIRPIEAAAGQALEKALAQDSSMRVRMSARTALVQYYLFGYRGGQPTKAAPAQTDEPPLATTPPPAMANGFVRKTVSVTVTGPVYSAQTIEPPLAPALPPPAGPLFEPAAVPSLGGSHPTTNPLSRNFTVRPLESTRLLTSPANPPTGIVRPR